MRILFAVVLLATTPLVLAAETVVQVSSGAVVVEPGTGSSSHLRSPGDFIVLQPEDRAHFRNSGGDSVNLAVVEVR